MLGPGRAAIFETPKGLHMAIKEIVDRSAEAADDDHWIGPKPSVVQMSAVLLVGTVALIIAGVQPLLLGALVTSIVSQQRRSVGR